MQVPIAKREVGINASQTPNVALQPMTAAASGANIGEAISGLGRTVGAATDALSSHLLAQRNHEEEQAANDEATKFAKDAQDTVLLNGVLSLKGANAKGATIVYDKSISDLKDKYGKDLQPRARELYNRIADTHANLWRNNVISHEIEQSNIADEQATASNVVTSAQTYAMAYGTKITDPTAQKKHESDMTALLGKARSETADMLKRKGLNDPATVKQELQKVDGRFAIESVKANPNNAGAILSSGKFDLSLKDRAIIQDIHTENLKNEFSNIVLTAKSSGMGLNDVISKYADNPKFNHNDENIKSELRSVARKAYAVTDYRTYNSLADGIESGTVKQTDIDTKFDAGVITQSDAESLSERLRKNNSSEGGGKLSPAMKISVDGLKLKAAEKFKTKQEEQEFMYVINQEAIKSGSPEQLYKKGIDLMEMVEIPTAHWWQNDDYRGYKVELEKQRSMDIAKAFALDNASKSLLKHGERDTPANRAAVIAKFPDGNY